MLHDDSLLPFVVVRGHGVTPHTRMTTVRMTSPTTASFLHASSSLSWPLVVWVQGAAPLTRVDADDSLLLVVVVRVGAHTHVTTLTTASSLSWWA
jgi:hypothetical protein